MDDILLQKYNWDTQKTEEIGKVSPHSLARSMTPQDFANVLSEYLNTGGKTINEGHEIGKLFTKEHRTLQRLAICFCLGIITGMSGQEFTDPRNETAIQTARKIKEMYDAGDLPLGFYI